MYRDGPTALYRLYDEHGQLLYLGITGNPAQRWKDHRKTMPWWPEVARREVEWLPMGRAGAVRVERAALAAERPLYERTVMVLPEGCPPPPPHAHHPPRAEYWPAWLQWRALFRELQLNPEERAALGR
jgi:predicted GIY-YIG superfamily endonuclease